jgi:hypothetical protein
MRRFLATACLLFLLASGLSAQQVDFLAKIRRHRSPEKRVLVDKVGTLTFDDTAHRLIFKDEDGDHLDVGYDEIGKIIFEVTTHMRAGAFSQAIRMATLAGAVAGTIVARGHVNNYWLYLEYKDHGSDQTALLEVPKNVSDEVIDKAGALFGSRVTVTNFAEIGVPVKVDDLKAFDSKQRMKVDKKIHPMPELKADKATIVVVCPPLAARDAGRGNQFKLHANDEIIAVNKMGTYSFAYLDPGKYRLVSQTENADGFDMELEAGKKYFFLQNTFQGVWKADTTLSRASPELGAYLLDGAYFSDWQSKKK